MTKSEFDQQVWHQGDLITLDNGQTGVLVCVHLSQRSVKVHLAQAEGWYKCDCIVSHTRYNGDNAFDDYPQQMRKMVNYTNKLQQDLNKSRENEVSGKLAKVFAQLESIQGKVKNDVVIFQRMNESITEMQTTINVLADYISAGNLVEVCKDCKFYDASGSVAFCKKHDMYTRPSYKCENYQHKEEEQCQSQQ